MEDADHVYFFFRESAVEYINCGKVNIKKITRLESEFTCSGQSLSRMHIHFRNRIAPIIRWYSLLDINPKERRLHENGTGKGDQKSQKIS